MDLSFAAIVSSFSRKLQGLKASHGINYRQYEDGVRELYLAARSLCEAATREQIRVRSAVAEAAELMQQSARWVASQKAVPSDSAAAAFGREIKQLRRVLLAGTR